VSTLAKEAAELVDEGDFTGLKLRFGRGRLVDDLAAIREVREAAGESIKLMVDFNQGLSLGDVLLRCHALDDQSPYWFDEPIAYDNLSGYAQLCGSSKRRCSLARISTVRVNCIKPSAREPVII
jgi:mandelate racemase